MLASATLGVGVLASAITSANFLCCNAFTLGPSSAPPLLCSSQNVSVHFASLLFPFKGKHVMDRAASSRTMLHLALIPRDLLIPLVIHMTEGPYSKFKRIQCGVGYRSYCILGRGALAPPALELGVVCLEIAHTFRADTVGETGVGKSRGWGTRVRKKPTGVG